MNKSTQAVLFLSIATIIKLLLNLSIRVYGVSESDRKSYQSIIDSNQELGERLENWQNTENWGDNA